MQAITCIAADHGNYWRTELKQTLRFQRFNRLKCLLLNEFTLDFVALSHYDVDRCLFINQNVDERLVSVLNARSHVYEKDDAVQRVGIT